MEKDPNPATGEVIAEFPTATRDEAIASVKAAHEAFRTWKDFPMRERAKMLFDMRGKFEACFG